VIATREEMVPKIMEDCIHAGVRGAVVISGGFSETGNRDLQNRIVSIAKEADFPFIGPNCLGIYSPPYVDTFFIPSERIIRPEKGKVTLISQSGGILVDHIIKLAGEGVGLSIAVSIGNKALIGEIELLDYFADEPETNVIAFYIEGFGEKEGRACVLRAGRCQKPVVVLKAGKTSSGGQTVSSHTAYMAGDYEVFSSALLQYGVVETKDETGKPMIAYVPHVEKFLMFVEGFQLNQIPVAHSIEEAVHMAKALKRSQAC